jgi:proton glutamate symport protein
MVPTNVVESAAATDMLGLITFALFFGIAMASLEGPAIESVRQLFQGLNAITLKITDWIMACAPIGVFALVTPVVAATGGSIFQALGWYFVTVLAGLGIHMFVTMPILLMVLGRINPRKHFAAMRDAILTAFSTASSNATLPVSMRCVRENAGVSGRVAGFTLPLGATVNMDGTALYECVAVIFVAQVLGVELSLATQVMVVVLALLTSIGVAGVPSASLVAIVLILQSVRIEGAGAAIAVLFSVDRLLDMSRTTVNIFGDTCGAVVIAKSEGETLFLDRQDGAPA